MPLLSRCRDTIALTLALSASLSTSLLGQTPNPTWTETVYPSPHSKADKRWLAFRVVDKLTGAPIPNAELLLIDEAAAPVTGAPIKAPRKLGDEDGFFSLEIDRKHHQWLCVRAEGYCQHMEMGAFDDEVIALSPSVAVPVQVRDWRNQPVSGAIVGFCSGCGHTPDLVHGITGATGLVTLPGVDVLQGIADFYVSHPDLELGYTSPTWFPSTQPMVIRLDPGIPHRGIVVDQEGKPIVGAAVGISDVHRGPWALTRQDGTFEVFGLDAACDLHVKHAGRKAIFSCLTTENLRLKFPEPDPDGRDTVVVYHLTEVIMAARKADEDREDLDKLREAAWPKVLVRTVDLPEDGSVTMRTKNKRWKLDDLISTATPVAIPDDEFVFELTGDDRSTRIIKGNREQALRDGLVRLNWYRPTIIEGIIVNEQGDSISADIHIEHLHNRHVDEPYFKTEVEGAISLPVPLEGMHTLTIRERYSGAIRRMPIELPPRGDKVFVDIGRVVVPEQSQLTVRAPDGTPLTKGDVHLLRLGFRTWEFEYENDQWWGPDLQQGDHVIVAAKLDPPKDLDVDTIIDVSSRFKIEGEGPWTVQQHGGEVLLDIDANGAKVGVTVGAHHISLTKPTLLRGLAPGKHKVFISAAGRRSATVDIEVASAGKDRCTLRLALPPAK